MPETNSEDLIVPEIKDDLLHVNVIPEVEQEIQHQSSKFSSNPTPPSSPPAALLARSIRRTKDHPVPEERLSTMNAWHAAFAAGTRAAPVKKAKTTVQQRDTGVILIRQLYSNAYAKV